MIHWVTVYWSIELLFKQRYSYFTVYATLLIRHVSHHRTLLQLPARREWRKHRWPGSTNWWTVPESANCHVLRTFGSFPSTELAHGEHRWLWTSLLYSRIVVSWKSLVFYCYVSEIKCLDIFNLLSYLARFSFKFASQVHPRKILRAMSCHVTHMYHMLARLWALLLTYLDVVCCSQSINHNTIISLQQTSSQNMMILLQRPPDNPR